MQSFTNQNKKIQNNVKPSKKAVAANILNKELKVVIIQNKQ